jgi:hypothetical protein
MQRWHSLFVFGGVLHCIFVSLQAGILARLATLVTTPVFFVEFELLFFFVKNYRSVEYAKFLPCEFDDDSEDLWKVAAQAFVQARLSHDYDVLLQCMAAGITPPKRYVSPDWPAGSTECPIVQLLDDGSMDALSSAVQDKVNEGYSVIAATDGSVTLLAPSDREVTKAVKAASAVVFMVVKHEEFRDWVGRACVDDRIVVSTDGT